MLVWCEYSRESLTAFPGISSLVNSSLAIMNSKQKLCVVLAAITGGMSAYIIFRVTQSSMLAIGFSGVVGVSFGMLEVALRD